jgi:hypothetical protein
MSIIKTAFKKMLSICSSRGAVDAVDNPVDVLRASLMSR